MNMSAAMSFRSGDDPVAANLVRLGTLMEDYLAEDRAGKPLSQLAPEDQEAVKVLMQKDLQGIDLTQPTVSLPSAVARAIPVARRPGGIASWTQNWPYEPLVGNTPTTSFRALTPSQRRIGKYFLRRPGSLGPLPLPSEETP